MTCAHCSRDIDFDSAFCRYCGASIATPGTGAAGESKRLTRIPARGKIGGVCAGLAQYLNTDVTLVRLLWVILSIVPGMVIGGLIAYLAAWLLMPPAGAATDVVAPARRLVRSRTDRRIAGVCGGLGAYLGVDSTLIRLASVILAIYPGAIIAGVIAYAIAWIVIPPDQPLTPVISPA